MYDPSSKFNLLGIPKLANFFNNKDYIPSEDVDSDGTTIKSSGCHSCLTWDHGQHMRNFTHGDSTLPKILLYQGSGYFNAFCTRLQQCYNDGIAFAFSSVFSMSPSHVATAAIVSDGKDSDGEDHAVQEDEVDWYTPPPPPPTLPLLPPLPLLAISPPSNTFELGMCLSFYDGAGQTATAVYEVVMPDGFTHTVRHQDGTRLNVHNAHLCLKMQANLGNIPRTPLEYCKEVGKGITKEDAENLAQTRILIPLQQELMDWHHCLYHLSFCKIFCLAEKGFSTKEPA
jgi:hypothetical protein